GKPGCCRRRRLSRDQGENQAGDPARVDLREQHLVARLVEGQNIRPGLQTRKPEPSTLIGPEGTGRNPRQGGSRRIGEHFHPGDPLTDEIAHRAGPDGRLLSSCDRRAEQERQKAQHDPCEGKLRAEWWEEGTPRWLPLPRTNLSPIGRQVWTTPGKAG